MPDTGRSERHFCVDNIPCKHKGKAYPRLASKEGANMKLPTQYLALGSIIGGLMMVVASRAGSTVLGLSTDFWAGFLLVISATFAALAVVSLVRRPAASQAL
jgi:hypothetical protein